MADKKVLVYINLDCVDYFVGTLWSHFSRGKETSDFEYSDEWINNKKSFSLEPGLYLGKGKQVNTRQVPLFGSFGDSSPDTWGRILMRRYENQLAKKENCSPRTLNEIDYLLFVNDMARQGALRFKIEDNEEFQYPSNIRAIPPLIDLTKLLAASEKIIESSEKESDLQLLLAPGSSLGGARPKASVLDKNGDLCIAKFPKKDDFTNNVLWEGVALTLASLCGLNVQKWSIQKAGKKNVILLKRFDRRGNIRIPFLSAMSMLNAVDNDSQIHSYLDIADAIRQYGSNTKEDLIELWKRMVFSILISNTDDHLRNHGFLYTGSFGWKLSPLYDVNPSPDNKNVLSTYITQTDNTQDIELALSVSEYFDLNMTEARQIINNFRSVIKNWRNAAKQLSLNSSEIDKMESAFRV
ncbi:MAG: type II toxin-antitoxin system HipA family toxin [Candidatus Gastranaerophilaceae bacterium]